MLVSFQWLQQLPSKQWRFLRKRICRYHPTRCQVFVENTHKTRKIIHLFKEKAY